MRHITMSSMHLLSFNSLISSKTLSSGHSLEDSWKETYAKRVYVINYQQDIEHEEGQKI